jgi:hypothetical protein
MMLNCAGCLRSFSRSGYTSHVRRTRNVNCIANFHAQTNRLDDDNNNNEHMDASKYMDNDECMDNDDHMNDISEPAAPVRFTGDLFGNYREEDFAWPLESGMSKFSIESMYHHN